MRDTDNGFSGLVGPEFFQRYPTMLTFLTTYRCNAQCQQCCFESNPYVKGELSLSAMKRCLDQAKREFPALRLVVFSGGECFLLGDSLFSALEHAHGLGFRTRCVTNAYWGKSTERAAQTVDRLKCCAISEINISTGADHQQWVPVECVVNAVDALVGNAISTLVTVESDAPTSDCFQDLLCRLRARDLTNNPLVSVRSNSWVAFKGESSDRVNFQASQCADAPCDQIFTNVVITPYRKLSACCGLTLEHIPEMRLGQLSEDGAVSLADLYWSQLDDFLKIWIHMDGPKRIMQALFPDDEIEDIDQFVHKCQACAVMHKHPEIRARLAKDYTNHVPQVLNRFIAKLALEKQEREQAERVVAQFVATHGEIRT